MFYVLVFPNTKLSIKPKVNWLKTNVIMNKWSSTPERSWRIPMEFRGNRFRRRWQKNISKIGCTRSIEWPKLRFVQFLRNPRCSLFQSQCFSSIIFQDLYMNKICFVLFFKVILYKSPGNNVFSHYLEIFQVLQNWHALD